jgi:tetratricopeptide (TPR) repeat protein
MPFRSPLDSFVPWWLRGFVLLTAAIVVLPVTARGQDVLSRLSAPYKWVEPLMPEATAPPEYRAYYDALDKARAQVAAGQYRRALVSLRTLGDEKLFDSYDVPILRATCFTALGKPQEALNELMLKGVSADPRAILLRARILIGLGRAAEVVEAAPAYVVAAPNSPLVRLAIGLAHEATGDTEGAAKAYAWFVDPPQNFLDRFAGSIEAFDSAEELTAVATAIDRWATLTGAYRDNTALHDTIYAMFTRAYDVVDRTYTPARVAAAAYAMSHDADAEAQSLLSTALEANPNDPAALDLAGRLAANVFNFDAADAMIARLRFLDDDSIPADLLEARTLLQQQRRPHEAEPPVRRVLAKQPRNVEALGLLAGIQGMAGDDTAMTATLKQVDAIDPHNATAYCDAADLLAFAHRMDKASALYTTAIERSPNWTAPHTGLGLLLMQGGDLTAARAAIDAARQLDPYNLKATNYARLLDDMTTFEQSNTEHFVFRYDTRDAVLIPYIGQYMEQAYTEVTTTFKYAPAGKIYVEIFPSKQAFSVRTSGQMGVESFGASLGPVVTAIAPRSGQTMGEYHWARVLRHEFTHCVNLLGTNYRCPRWLTEGLAVWQENVEYRFANLPPQLYAAVMTDKLLTIDRLHGYFLRPDRRISGEVAYMQGFWIVRYLIEKHGPDSIVTLLDAYRDGLDDRAAFKKATGDEIGAFEQKFFAWAKERVRPWGYDQASQEKFKILSEEAENATAARQDDVAIAAWEKALAIQPMNPIPRRRLAGLYLRKKEPVKAVPHLAALVPLELQDNRYPKRIARIYRDDGNLAEARRFAMEAVYINPYDIDAYKLLAELADKAGNANDAERANAAITELEKSGQAKPATP